jgi:signal transduction histidine kinase
MLSSLERSLERERQFVDQASHELRTPITLLSSRIQLARRRPRSQAEHERILTELQVDLDRLASLAEQLLQLGSAAGGRRGDGTDLAAAAARVVSQRRLALPDHAGELSLEVIDEPLPVPMADVEADRILTNLLDNATVHGAAPVGVTVDRPTQGWARLLVTDAGSGMPASLLGSATQRFARAEEARSRPGAGLGLSLVTSLATEAGGELRLCHDGHHTSYGRSAPVPCTHGPAMTVTVLLPTAEPR